MNGWTSGALRLSVAVALMTAALAFPARLADGPRPRPPRPAPPVVLEACPAAGCPDAVLEAQVARFEDHLSERMPAAGQELQAQLARAIVIEAEAARVNPLLVFAMIEVESGFDLRALSSAGAQGLMQLLPGTMRRELEVHGIQPSGPADPIANVRAGVRYLRRCLDAYPRSLDLGLMAYNTGPNRVYGLLQAGGDMPEWALAYPRRVQAELRKLERRLGADKGPRFAEAPSPALAR